jgi:tRNA A-37 threonylcarbamoyl transferase component Bud32
MNDREADLSFGSASPKLAGVPMKMSEPDPTIDLHQPSDPLGEEAVPPGESDAAIVSILDRYTADLRAGNAPDRQQLLAAHPELASRLEDCLAGIEFVHGATAASVEEPAVLGEFRIIRELGRGGMGVVYEAEQTSLRRRVALKVLRYGAVADAEAMERFRREAETVARLHHTNIVPIFAVGCERGVHYYAMQFIEGRSLADVLADSHRADKPVLPADVARWGLQAAEALAHAHQRGVIHRDIKPSNLLLDAEDTVWLTDFGLAKCSDEVTLTLCGMLLGTPRYMSPEQAESVRRPIDHRTDVYSLGASLYELATGRPVFASTAPMGVIAQILNEEPAPPRRIRPDLPRDLETVILTCLAKEPGRRYATARALAEDLRAVLAGRGIRARRARAAEIVVRYVRARKKSLAAAAILVAATVLLMVGSFLGWRSYADWRLGRVVLTTAGPALSAVVLPESGEEPVGEPFDIGTHTALSLPAGDYRLRVQGAGLLGQTYHLAINRGESRSYRVSLDASLLGDLSIPYPPAGDALMLKPGKADLIEWTADSLVRWGGGGGKPI